MKDISKIKLPPTSKIIDVIKIIEQAGMQIALVVDDNDRLLGTVTDGDIRRGLLKGIGLEEPIDKIMFCSPTVGSPDMRRDEILKLMKDKDLRQIPLIDKDGRVTGIELSRELNVANRNYSVVLMVGGLGRRLGELTENCPKPLLKVGDKPILETIISNASQYGLKKFYLSINYKGEMIKDYFGDGSRWGVSIDYLEEKEQLGTAGSLSLIPEADNSDLIVMNGDLLTKVNFEHLLEFHHSITSDATMCVREYDLKVPFGVVQTDGYEIVSIDEKPNHKFFVNAGIYVISKSVVNLIAPHSHMDMTTLFEKLVAERKKTAAFPIHEYWLDIGRLSDFQKASHEYKEHFD